MTTKATILFLANFYFIFLWFGAQASHQRRLDSATVATQRRTCVATQGTHHGRTGRHTRAHTAPHGAHAMAAQATAQATRVTAHISTRHHTRASTAGVGRARRVLKGQRDDGDSGRHLERIDRADGPILKLELDKEPCSDFGCRHIIGEMAYILKKKTLWFIPMMSHAPKM